jgi:hypothetical protein
MRHPERFGVRRILVSLLTGQIQIAFDRRWHMQTQNDPMYYASVDPRGSSDRTSGSLRYRAVLRRGMAGLQLCYPRLARCCDDCRLDHDSVHSTSGTPGYPGDPCKAGRTAEAEGQARTELAELDGEEPEAIQEHRFEERRSNS